MNIESYEHGCQVLGLDPEAILPDVSRMPEEFQASTIAQHKLNIICKASREGVVIDWNHSKQYKWQPWFYMDDPGFRFHASFYDFGYAYATSGSRLCYLSKEDSDWHAKKHLVLYCTMMHGSPVKEAA